MTTTSAEDRDATGRPGAAAGPGRPPARREERSATALLAGASVQRLGLPVLWGLLCAVFAFIPETSSTFPTISTFGSIFGAGAVTVILTLAVIVPATAGDYDLSVAYTLTISSMVVAILDVNHHVEIWLAILCALAVGALIGAVNGIVAVRFGVDPFIATLGSGTVIAGVTLWISHSNPVAGVSPGLTDFVSRDSFLGIPLEFYLGLALCLVMWFVMTRLPAGRRLRYVGLGREVARLSGVRVHRIRYGAFLISGVLSACAGIIYTGAAGAADPTSGTTLLLPAFAAAFLGATTIQPGQFNPMGALIAVYFLGTGITGLELLGGSSYVQDLFYGGALIVAVVASQTVRRRAQTRRELSTRST